MERRERVRCGHPCFECPHPDCVADAAGTVLREKRRPGRPRDPHSKERKMEYDRAYYWRNRERILARLHASKEAAIAIPDGDGGKEVAMPREPNG